MKACRRMSELNVLMTESRFKGLSEWYCQLLITDWRFCFVDQHLTETGEGVIEKFFPFCIFSFHVDDTCHPMWSGQTHR